MTDVFEEVEEQLRADRYKTLALRALPWVLGALALALIIALAIWGWGAWQSRTISEASETYAEGVEAFAAGDMGKAEQRFAEVAPSLEEYWLHFNLHAGFAAYVKLRTRLASLHEARCIEDSFWSQMENPLTLPLTNPTFQNR